MSWTGEHASAYEFASVNDSQEVRFTMMYNAYTKWCEEHGLVKADKNLFEKAIMKLWGEEHGRG